MLCRIKLATCSVGIFLFSFPSQGTLQTAQGACAALHCAQISLSYEVALERMQKKIASRAIGGYLLSWSGSKMKTPVQSTSLLNGDRVAIVGGGPSGSFFAIHLLREAEQLDRNIEVVIVEKRGPSDLNFDDFQCRGCNFCAGLISPRLNEILDECGLVVPEEVIQGRIDYVWIHGQWKNLRLRVPKDKQMYSVFRGSLPGRRTGRPAGFDGFLLGEAVKEGARIQ